MKSDLARLAMALSVRIPPEAWDALIPHSGRLRARLADELELNPQPLPPRSAYLAASLGAAREVVRAAVAVELAGGSPGEAVGQLMRGWCGNEPRPWPFPVPFPWPDPDPEPWRVALEDPALVASGQLLGALALGRAAAGMGDGPAAGAVAGAAGQLLEAAIGG